MTLNRNLIVVVALVLVATSLLISSLDYSSGVIHTGGGRPGLYTFVGSNETGADTAIGGESQQGNISMAPEPDSFTGEPFTGMFSDDQGNGSSSADVRDSGNTLLVISLAAIIIAAMGVAVYMIARRRRRTEETASVKAIVATPQPRSPDTHEGLFKLQFPQIREPLPLTWGYGEPLEMTVRGNGATVEARLSIDGREAGPIRLENGCAAVPLRLAKGDHKITVSPTGSSASGSESWVTVRIVDYREEVVRMFNDLCHRYLPAADGPAQEMTPREIEQLIGASMPEEKQRPLGEAVTTFERANYSLHDVRRDDYENMYLSERCLA